MTHSNTEIEPCAIETGVSDLKGGMDGTVRALENALGDQGGVKITIDDNFGTTLIKVLTTRPTSDEAAPVPADVDKQLRDWGYEREDHVGNIGHYVYKKQ